VGGGERNQLPGGRFLKKEKGSGEKGTRAEQLVGRWEWAHCPNGVGVRKNQCESGCVKINETRRFWRTKSTLGGGREGGEVGFGKRGNVWAEMQNTQGYRYRHYVLSGQGRRKSVKWTRKKGLELPNG